MIELAHNRDLGRRLRQTLDDYLPGRPVTLLFGASADKDIPGMFAELLPRVSRVFATQSVHPRAAPAEDLAALAHRFGCPAAPSSPCEDALAAALECSRATVRLSSPPAACSSPAPSAASGPKCAA